MNALSCLAKSGGLSIAPPETPADIEAWFYRVKVNVSADDIATVTGYLSHRIGVDGVGIIECTPFAVINPETALYDLIAQKSSAGEVFGVKILL